MADEQNDLHTEPFTGGMVLSRDPALLAEGELSFATNCHYRITTDALCEAPSRALLTNVGPNKISGIVPCNLTGTESIIAQSGNALYNINPTGPTITLATITGGEYLAGLQYTDPTSGSRRAALFNGSSSNQIVYSNKGTLAVRQQGLNPVTITPGANVTSGTGGHTWSDSPDTGWYEYWTTEVLDLPDGGFIESAFTGKPANKNVDATTKVVVVSQPLPHANSNATKWRIYRSTKKSTELPLAFPTGLLLAELDIATNTFIDQSSSNASASGTLLVFNTNGWTNPGNITGAADTNYATAITNSQEFLDVGNFGIPALGGFTLPVIGVVVTVTYKFTAPANPPFDILSAQINNGTDWSPKQVLSTIPTATNLTTSAGGPADLWGFTFLNGNNLANGNFKVRLSLNTAGGTTFLDSVTVTVYFNGTAPPAEPYHSVTFSLAEQTISDSEDGLPPISSIGDIFNDSLVVNDMAFLNYVRYSVPGKYESYPDVYYIPVPLRAGDYITCIITLGPVLLVGTQYGLYRVNYLPTELDSTLDRGKVLETVDPDYGPASLTSYSLLRGPDGRIVLAYATKTDIRMTDGFVTQPIAQDFAYSKEVDVTDMGHGPDRSAGIFLINNPKNWELILYFKPNGKIYQETGWLQAAIRLNYHPRHLGQSPFDMKCSGAIACFNKPLAVSKITTAAYYNSVNRGEVFTGFDNGDVFFDAQVSNTTPWPGEKKAIIRTRMMYLNGMTQAWRLRKLHLHHSDPIGDHPVRFLIKPITTKINDDSYLAHSAKIITATNNRSSGILQRTSFNILGDAFEFELTTDNNPVFALNSLLLLGEQYSSEGS